MAHGHSMRPPAGLMDNPRTGGRRVHHHKECLMHLNRFVRSLIRSATLAGISALGTVSAVLGVTTGGGFPG